MCKSATGTQFRFRNYLKSKNYERPTTGVDSVTRSLSTYVMNNDYVVQRESRQGSFKYNFTRDRAEEQNKNCLEM